MTIGPQLNKLPYITLILLFIAYSAEPDAFERGMAAFRKRDFPAAQRELTKLVREHPSSARAWKLLGMVYSSQDKYDSAEGPLRRACELNAQEENACYYLGRLYFTVSRLADSLDAFNKAPLNGRVLLGRALALEAMSRPEEAQTNYKRAMEAGESRASIDYGLFLFKQGKGAESLEILRKAGAQAEVDRVLKALAEKPEGQTAATVVPRFSSSTLDMVVNNGATGEKHLIETMIAGVAVFDFDNDGWPDIFVANGAAIPNLEKTGPEFHNRLFRNNRDGTFADVTQKSGLAGQGYAMGVATADYDNDGNVDLFVTGVRSSHLYRNRGDGSFADVTAQSGIVQDGLWSVAAAWFDYDNDGLLDLFVVRYVEWDPAKETWCGRQEPGYRQYCHPRMYSPLPNALYHNEGNGKFRDVSRDSGVAAHSGKGMGVAIGDFDGDGKLDVFVANDTVPNFLFHNEGGGKFTDVAFQSGVALNDSGAAVSAMGVDFRDYDNDGREDLFFTALTNESYPLFRNLGGGHFSDMTYPSGIGRATVALTGWGAGMFDFNNDGRKDILTANGHVMDNAELTSSRQSRQANLLLINEGVGKFKPVALPGEALHRGLAFGDFDRDGRMDAVVTRLNEKPLVLHNTTPLAGHWIEFRLTGTLSNRDGIGARVHVTTATGEHRGEQWNRVTTSVGYACSSDRIVHIGLGTAARVTQVEIDWPSGIKQKLTDIAADRVVEIKEPASNVK